MNSYGRQRQLQQAMESANLQTMWSNLSFRSVKEPGHVMELSIADLIHLGQGTHEQAEAAMLIAARLLAPRCTPLLTQLHAELSSQALTLGIPDIDSALGGGLLTSSITELVGSAGMTISFSLLVQDPERTAAVRVGVLCHRNWEVSDVHDSCSTGLLTFRVRSCHIDGFHIPYVSLPQVSCMRRAGCSFPAVTGVLAPLHPSTGAALEDYVRRHKHAV